MPLKEQASLWSDTTIKMLDVRSGTLPPGGVMSETGLTANVLLLAGGREGRLVMNGEICHIQAYFACHAVKGSAFTLTAGSETIHYTVIMYKAFPMLGAAHVLFPQRNHPLRTSFVHRPVLLAELHQTAEQIEAKWSRGEGLERFHANALLQGMLYELIMEYECGQKGTEADMVDVVAAYIAGHYRQELELKELAALAGCSTRQLQRRFKQEKLLGPMEYVIQLRMESAERMLRHTDAPIGEIAEKRAIATCITLAGHLRNITEFPADLQAHCCFRDRCSLSIFWAAGSPGLIVPVAARPGNLSYARRILRHRFSEAYRRTRRSICRPFACAWDISGRECRNG